MHCIRKRDKKPRKKVQVQAGVMATKLTHRDRCLNDSAALAIRHDTDLLRFLPLQPKFRIVTNASACRIPTHWSEQLFWVDFQVLKLPLPPPTFMLLHDLCYIAGGRGQCALTIIKPEMGRATMLPINGVCRGSHNELVRSGVDRAQSRSRRRDSTVPIRAA